jgi:RsiW-degrading membrane proteinase PrsW (M82 family)
MIVALFAILFSAVLWLWFLYRYDKVEPEPIKTVIYIGIFGGLFSAVPAGILNEMFRYAVGIQDVPWKEYVDLSNITLLSFAAYVGCNEEICKSTAAVFLLRKCRDFNEPIDALIYSMTVALGFAVFENIEYTLRGGLGVLVLRSFTAVPFHMGLASFWGIGIAKAKYLKKEQYFKTLIPYIVIAAILHGAYDYFLFSLPNGVLTLSIALIFAYFVIHLSRRQLIYLRGQSPFVKAGTCPYCNTINKKEDRFCKKCGKSLVQDYFAVCLGCGEKVLKQAKFCSKCGAELVLPTELHA